MFGDLDKPTESLGRDQVIAIQNRDPGAPRNGKAMIPRRCRSLISLPSFDSNARIRSSQAFDDFRRSIRRAIVDDDDLNRYGALRQC